MAIFDFAPAIERSRKVVSENTNKVVLRLVPELANGKKADTHTFGFVVGAVFIGGLISLLIINTALTQDAFKLQELKIQATTLADQREAILREVAAKSSPNKLAQSAVEMGMVVNLNPKFLDLTANEIKP
jgi:hypothetical protein